MRKKKAGVPETPWGAVLGPRFEKMEKVGQEKTVADAMDRFYRPERLRTSHTSRVELIASVERWIELDGSDCLASRHESNLGVALWIRPEGDGFGIYGHIKRGEP